MPDDVVDVVLVDRQPAVAGGQRRLQRLGHRRRRASSVTMSGRGTITSRTTVSPKSMIEWMKAALVGLDHVLVVGHVGHGQQLGLGDV